MWSHDTWMVFALHETYSKFCRDDLMMVNWPKHVVKVEIKVKTYIVVIDWGMKLFVFFRHCCYESHNITWFKNQQLFIKNFKDLNEVYYKVIVKYEKKYFVIHIFHILTIKIQLITIERPPNKTYYCIIKQWLQQYYIVVVTSRYC
jgi:hypothetical protein